MYVGGFSTSLPAPVQLEMLKSLPGLENVHVIKPAYAVEYDYVPAVQTTHSLMSKNADGLFFAGQINGTSGYEEAAAQGLVAGINAVNYIRNQEPMILSRESSYIGTLIDDLVTKDIDEPYRMLTSRSEYRLILRQDNADERLTEIGYRQGLASGERYTRYLDKANTIKNEIERLKNTKISATDEINTELATVGEHISEGIRMFELLKRPNISYELLKKLDKTTADLDYSFEIGEQTEIRIKYEGYIKRQLEQVEMSSKADRIKIPQDIDYQKIQHISTETKEKLDKIRPVTLGQAARIGGVKPADIAVLSVLIESKAYRNNLS